MTEVQLWGLLTPTHHECLMAYAALGESTFPRSQVVADLARHGLVTVHPAETRGDVRLSLTARGEALVAWAEMLRKHR